MAIKRIVSTEFWTDKKVVEQSEVDRIKRGE